MTSAASSAAVSDVETRLDTRDGAMLFDATLGDVANDDWFEPGRWPSSATAAQVAGGRGGVIFLRDGERRWVLRHYRRGGAVATLLGDRYLWTGEDRTRAFREWRLLRQLEAWALPVPRAIAARYRRTALCYRADLITEQLPSTTTLARTLALAGVDDSRWRSIGKCLKRFHERGVQHADLNAHNVLLGGDDSVFLLDFDRGRVRARGGWEEAVLARLQRSLLKVTRDLPPGRFDENDWRALRAGYDG
jgi:3-deoxy-D-manno-octulosonic acid kinase